MSNNNDGGPAFAHAGCPNSPEDCVADGEKSQRGMSLRDYFAAQALSGLLANPKSDSVRFDDYAKDAWKMADAMLKAREVKP